MNPCKPSLQTKILLPYNEEEDPLKIHLTLDGLEDQGSPTICQEEAVEAEAEEEEEMAERVEGEVEKEAETEEIKMTEDRDPS